MRRLAFVLFFVGLLIALVFIFIFSSDKKSTEKITYNNLPTITSKGTFFEIDNFQKAVAKAEQAEERSDIKAIVVPQHLLASELIASQLKRAIGSNIENVIIIGPNHFETGVEEIASTRAIWQTYFGPIGSDSPLTNRFITELDVVDQTSVFENEHAIGAIVPFVKYYIPDAKILPIALSANSTELEVSKVSNWLSENVSDNTLIIYSIDFSHYLTREQADIKDAETKELIEDGNVGAIMTLGNDHIDSPASIAVALQYAEAKNLETKILSTYNSDDFSVNRTPETTSYFEIIFTPAKKEAKQEAEQEAPQLEIESKKTTLMFVGDMMLSRYIGIVMEEQKDWAWPFRLVADYTRSADILFGNLEGPISDKGNNVGSIYSFRADPRVVDGLNLAGFDVLSVANNHIGDWNREAMEDTFRILGENNILYPGGGANKQEAHSAKIKEVNGVRFGFLAYTYPLSISGYMKATDTRAGVTDFNVENMTEDIKRAKEVVDIVIVSFHYGPEYSKTESASQRAWSRAAVDAGAKIVVGHHPHVTQRVEQYNDGYIAYSLGNFIFDQFFSEETMKGMILKIVFDGYDIVEVEEIPTRIEKPSQVFITE